MTRHRLRSDGIKTGVQQSLMTLGVPGFGVASLLAPTDLVWERRSEISVAWKAEAFSEDRERKFK